MPGPASLVEDHSLRKISLLRGPSFETRRTPSLFQSQIISQLKCLTLSLRNMAESQESQNLGRKREAVDKSIPSKREPE